MKYVYELNLPPAKEIYLESFKGFDDDDMVFNYQHIINPKILDTIIKKEWLNFADYKWDQLMYFKKNNHVGKIHTDIGGNKRPDFNPWGISWIYGGDGLIEYWDHKDLTEDGISLGSFNRKSAKVMRYQPINPPSHSYSLLENKVYLVYGKQPHRATGYAGRKILNLRSWQISYLPWEEVVNLFKDYHI